MEIPEQPVPRQSGRRARRLTCQDGYHRMLSVGLWAVPSLGVVVMVAPVAESARFTREQAISLRAALDETIAELPAPPV
ncbi:MAG TPA: hypothetical protein VK887_11795 [Pseudonocardiaceae bacterium]|nr:hypothetical protein [Pseudonocardiaceae bacterium]